MHIAEACYKFLDTCIYELNRERVIRTLEIKSGGSKRKKVRRWWGGGEAGNSRLTDIKPSPTGRKGRQLIHGWCTKALGKIENIWLALGSRFPFHIYISFSANKPTLVLLGWMVLLTRNIDARLIEQLRGRATMSRWGRTFDSKPLAKAKTGYGVYARLDAYACVRSDS